MSVQIQFIEERAPSEVELIEKAQQGDKSAFKQIYQLHHKRVYGLCFRLSGQIELAEEATQDTFVRLWQKLPQFKGDSQFSTWLHRLTVNQALTSIKKHKTFWARFLPITDETDLGQETLEYELLDKLLLQLPERARIVFILFEVEGYKHNEIANLLGIATGTSKAQLHRAKKLLQEML